MQQNKETRLMILVFFSRWKSFFYIFHVDIFMNSTFILIWSLLKRNYFLNTFIYIFFFECDVD